MKQHSIFDAGRLAACVACLVAGLVGCGGGVDSGGTGSPVALSAGPVSGLGSIVVNGVRYELAGRRSWTRTTTRSRPTSCRSAC